MTKRHNSYLPYIFSKYWEVKNLSVYSQLDNGRTRLACAWSYSMDLKPYLDRHLSKYAQDIWMCALDWLVTMSVDAGDVAP